MQISYVCRLVYLITSALISMRKCGDLWIRSILWVGHSIDSWPHTTKKNYLNAFFVVECNAHHS